MREYTILCTPEQTKKAFELGAPLHLLTVDDEENFIEVVEDGMYNYYEIPTAEEMIGWLEEQDIYISICWEYGIYHVPIRNVDIGYIGIDDKIYTSRKEATLAAIDWALDYLMKIKENG